MSTARLATILLGCALFAASPAQAYVLTRTDSGTAVRWQVSCIFMSPDVRGDQSGDSITINDIELTLEAAITTWNTEIQTCGYIQLGLNPATQVLDAVSDGKPAVVFHSDFWGRGTETYSPAAIALTTVWYANKADDPTDGQISDADIELNAVNYSFTTTPASAVPRAGTDVADLQNTLTHELGHVMGLAHTCWDHKTSTPPLDNNGQPAPDCNLAPDLPAAVMDATMYPYSQPGSTGMRIVGPDDLNGVCTSYSDTTQATACYGYIQSGGCQYGRARFPSPTTVVGWIVLSIVLFGGAIRWRSRRRARAVA